jgi:hypothetical protein
VKRTAASRQSQQKRPHGHPNGVDCLILSVITGSVCLKVREPS